MTYRWRCAAILAGMVIAAAPSRAEACSIIECERLVDIALAHEGSIPAGEAALVLRPTLADEFPIFNAPKSQAAVAVTVTPTMGGPAVPGEVVAIDELDLLVWRPGSPLDPDTEYQVAVTVDNTMLEHEGCGPDGFARMFSVTTGAVMSVPLTVPEVTASAKLLSKPWFRPETMVCCDGAIPFDGSGSCGPSVGWEEGTCAAGSSFASLAVTAMADPVAIEETMGQVGYHFSGRPIVPGTSETTLLVDQPICGQLTAIHLMTGEVMSGPEVCAGQELAAMLGEQVADPTPGLGACVGEPYTCAVIQGPNGELWDGESCTPWPEGQATTGGESSTGEASTGAETGGAVTQGATGDEPTGGDPTGEGSSGDASAGGSGGEPGEKGCACGAGEGAAPWGALAVVLSRLRRRRRPAEVR